MLGINNACSQARTFFTQQPDTIKQTIKGYSGFGTELVRGEIPMPKESVYFLPKKWHSATEGTPGFSPLCNVVIQSATRQHMHQGPESSLADQFLIRSANLYDTHYLTYYLLHSIPTFH